MKEYERATKADKKRISSYTRKDVDQFLQRDLKLYSVYEKTLREALYVLHFHPDQIVRHEAAFVLSEFPYRGELEKSLVVRELRSAFREDTSIVAKHEIMEALGEICSPSSVGATADLAKILRFRNKYHEDLVKTAEDAFDNLIAYLEQKDAKEIVAELKRWTNPKVDIRDRRKS